MNRHLLIFMLFSVLLLARYEAYPLKECPAFNNMKHSKNTHDVVLDIHKEYKVLKHHKGQTLIVVKGEHSSQRWVDAGCFPMDKEALSYPQNRTKSPKNQSRQNILALSWHNAFCQTHQYKKECRRSMFSRYKESHFVLHGLWPQPKNNLYCNVERKLITLDKHKQWNRLPALSLSRETMEGLSYYMPGFDSYLHRHEWIKHGTCYGTDAQRYYSDVLSLMGQFEKSRVNAFFAKNRGKSVTLAQVRHFFDRNFGSGTGKRVEMRCKKGLLTEIWLHLGSGSDDLATLLKRGNQIRSQCKQGHVDRAGF